MPEGAETGVQKKYPDSNRGTLAEGARPGLDVGEGRKAVRPTSLVGIAGVSACI